MASDMVRPRWWFSLRAFLGFFVGGGLGSLAYLEFRHHPLGAMPWGQLLFGSLVCASVTALFPARRRR